MGANQSNTSDRSKHVFSKELSKLNKIVNKLVSNDDKFVNPNYNFLFEDVCKNYTIMWEKELNKHLKIDLDNLSGSLYLLPKKDNIVSKDDDVEINKHELCQKISKHYVKILYILSLVKTVYDLENDGDNSLAGIMKRNVNVVDNNIMEISYCSIPHKDYATQTPEKINFSHLQGFDVLINRFLTPSEKNAFLQQFKAIFSRKPRNKIIEHVCQDSLVPLEIYDSIYSKKFKGEAIKCNNDQQSKVTNSKHSRKNVDLLFEIVADNPILHSNYCMSNKKLIIPLNRSNPDVRTLMELFYTMNNNYQKNIEKVVEILNLLIEVKGDKYDLRNISSDELLNIVKKVKKEVIVFYIQSIVDFHVLLDHAKKIPSVKTNK